MLRHEAHWYSRPIFDQVVSRETSGEPVISGVVRRVFSHGGIKKPQPSILGARKPLISKDLTPVRISPKGFHPIYSPFCVPTYAGP